ncbi:hypothetical protein F511_36312 [Dorcoceras hygrometricum]|uniref:Uncharacterized protein n=1 Tax=Dorcoceras hygrometricum TaxID=472368 RepID=A0A2Z7B499_9LAMI|nr:hypothetical protein F511_36312 [Dorcoceras hygrometricum]
MCYMFSIFQILPAELLGSLVFIEGSHITQFITLNLAHSRLSPPLQAPPPPPAADRRRKICSGQLDVENPFVLISSGLLVQPDEGVSDLVVDRIGVSTAIYREEPAHSRLSPPLQAPPPPPPPPPAADRRRKICSGQLDVENPFVLISSGLLVQPDEGVSDLVVDRIGVSTAIYREEPGS